MALRAIRRHPHAEAGCECHDPIVFGHQPPCFAAIPAPPACPWGIPHCRERHDPQASGVLVVPSSTWTVIRAPLPVEFSFDLDDYRTLTRPWNWSVTISTPAYNWRDFARYLISGV